MSSEQFERELVYQATMCVVSSMLAKGLISSEEYDRIDESFREKYRPLIGR